MNLMPITRRQWLRFGILAAFSLSFWFALSYPQLTFIDLSIKRQDAFAVAERYLQAKEVNPGEYYSAAVLTSDSSTNKYLQRTLGFDGMLDFLKIHDVDMYFWLIRFFKEGDPEEFRLTVSASTGEVISYKHTLKETAARPVIEREAAKQEAVEFLNEKFGFKLDHYLEKGDLGTIYDNRTDYSFSWIKKTVAVPWSDQEKAGTAKLATGITISGDEVLSFYKNSFSIPNEFTRDEIKKSNIANNIGLVVGILEQGLLILAIYFLIARRNHLAMHLTKRLYLIVFFVVFGLSIAAFFNQFESFIFNYKTTLPFADHFTRSFVSLVVAALIASIGLLMPGLSGELLHFEVARQEQRGAFLAYCQSTFFSRQVAILVCFGYVVFFIILGMQSVITSLGESYLGVWTEQPMAKVTNAYWPVLAAVTVGFNAAVFEEIMYRLFAISLFRKIFRSVVAAVLLSSLIWGFGHAGYPVYPMWFRGVEVSLIGLVMAFIYVRFGLIPVLVAHFLFDVFWSCAAFLFGQATPVYFWTSIFVMLIPGLWAIAALYVNSPVEEKPLAWKLNKYQQFNTQVLAEFLKSRRDEFEAMDDQTLIEYVAKNNWDIAVVEDAVRQFRDATS